MPLFDPFLIHSSAAHTFPKCWPRAPITLPEHISGRIWTYLLISGLLAHLLIFHLSGLICSHLAYLDISGRICLYLGISGRTWTHLGVSAYIWAYLSVSCVRIFYLLGAWILETLEIPSRKMYKAENFKEPQGTAKNQPRTRQTNENIKTWTSILQFAENNQQPTNAAHKRHVPKWGGGGVTPHGVFNPLRARGRPRRVWHETCIPYLFYIYYISFLPRIYPIRRILWC